MKAPSFDYARPTSLPEAFALLERHRDGARILAGGQSLMATLNMRLSAPEILVDINAIEGLSGIALDGEMLRIGAMTRHFEVERSALVARHAPLIAQAMPHIAHAAIRNRGTFGGSLAFADPAAELPACAVALSARMVLQSSRGRRTVTAAEFFQGLYRTALAQDEIMVACEVPIASGEIDQPRSGEPTVLQDRVHGNADDRVIAMTPREFGEAVARGRRGDRHLARDQDLVRG